MLAAVVFVAAWAACIPLGPQCHHDAVCAFGSLKAFEINMEAVAAATDNCTAAPVVCDASVDRYAATLFSPGCNPNPATHAAAMVACADVVTARPSNTPRMLCDNDSALTLEDDLFAAVISVVAVFLAYRALERFKHADAPPGYTAARWDKTE